MRTRNRPAVDLVQVTVQEVRCHLCSPRELMISVSWAQEGATHTKQASTWHYDDSTLAKPAAEHVETFKMLLAVLVPVQHSVLENATLETVFGARCNPRRRH